MTDNLDTIASPPESIPKGIPLDLIIDYIENRELSITETAKLLDCSKQNISERLQRAGLKPKYLEKFKNHRADILAAYQARILNGLTTEDIKKASLVQKTTAFGTLYDKERLERGQSTENIAYADRVKMDEQYRQEIKKILDEYKIDPQEIEQLQGNSDAESP